MPWFVGAPALVADRHAGLSSGFRRYRLPIRFLVESQWNSDSLARCRKHERTPDFPAFLKLYLQSLNPLNHRLHYYLRKLTRVVDH